MQQLYYPTESEYEPDTTVIYTPHLAAPGYPDERLIAVDLNARITRVLNSDYWMLELLDGHEVQAFLLNTGRVGGDDHPGPRR
jgi:hypothetical protein